MGGKSRSETVLADTGRVLKETIQLAMNEHLIVQTEEILNTQ